MACWREEYMKALGERDERERASYDRISVDFITSCMYFPRNLYHISLLISVSDTNLLERTAALEAEKAANTSSTEPSSKDPASANPTEGDAQLRSDLAEALRSNGQLQTRIKAAEKELVDLRAKTKTDTRRIADLSRERATLLQKVKDRDDELRGKARFLEVWLHLEGGGKY